MFLKNVCLLPTDCNKLVRQTSLRQFDFGVMFYRKFISVRIRSVFGSVLHTVCFNLTLYIDEPTLSFSTELTKKQIFICLWGKCPPDLESIVLYKGSFLPSLF